MKLLENVVGFEVHPINGPSYHSPLRVERLAFARHASRDTEGTRKELDAVRARGYAVHGNPSICMKSRYLLTQEGEIEVQGRHTSGEVEAVAVIANGGEILVSVGSDHNDRSLESMWTEALGHVYDTAKSKQMAPAVVARDAWLYRDVQAHWDRLCLRSSVTVDGQRIPYQDFTLDRLVALETHFMENPWLRREGSVLFGGTAGPLPTVPGNVFRFQSPIRDLSFPPDFHFELHDPILDRTISHGYSIKLLEEPGSISL